MCLAIPGEVLSIEDGPLASGVVAFGGVQKQVCLAYTPEARVGDFVLVHVGFAISVVDRAQAARTLALLAELGDLEALQPSTPIAPAALSAAPPPKPEEP